MENLKNLLNNEQYEAVCSRDKYLRIIAGAGSGKTRVLTYRICYLIEECGYSPTSILAITFTNKAADEIKKRIVNMVACNPKTLKVATFHSFCARILREECKCIDYPATFTILDDDDQKKIVNGIVKEKHPEDAKLIKVKNILDYIAGRKNNRISPESAITQANGNDFLSLKAHIYQEYDEYLTTNYCFDFDDLILKTIDIFEDFPNIKEKWQERLNHILVDEFQDVDPNQYYLLKLLAGNKNEVTVVGDPDQTIYTWRGADVNIILNFDRDFKDAKTIQLEQNYRSTSKILNMANTLISHNHNRIKKNLFTNQAGGAEIYKFNGDDEMMEAKYVVDNINDLYDGKETMYSSFAILYRNNAQSSKLEEVLMQRGIKYKIYGGIKFFKRAEIKDCISYLNLALNMNDNFSAERLIRNTVEKIGETTIEKIKTNARNESLSITDHLRLNYSNLPTLYKKTQGENLKAFIDNITKLHDELAIDPKNGANLFADFLQKCGYLKMLVDAELDEKVDNIKEFLNQMKDSLKQEENTLVEFVQNAALMASQDEIEDEGEDFVKLMTIHTAKGLEFDNVFVYGLVDGIFPSQRALFENPANIEEERRLFYVAITRARKRLYLSTSGGYDCANGSYRHPSRFLKEIESQAATGNIQIKKEQYVVNNVQSIRPGSIISHDMFGEGMVIAENAGIITVIFKDPSVGKKVLNASHKFIHLKK